MSRLILIVAIVAGFAVLCGLGTWQVKRLYWKEALIEKAQSRMAGNPVSLADVENAWHENADVEYLNFNVTGEFDHTAEMYYYTTYKGNVGWEVLAPLTLQDGRKLIVSRGFVPVEQKQAETRTNGLFEGMQTLRLVARNPLHEKPNRFMPDNDLNNREFFWKNYEQLVGLTGGEGDNFLPFLADEAASPRKALPIRGVTRVSFPNNHLQYAVTWYGLALALLGVGGYFLYSRERDTKSGNKSRHGSI